MGILSFRTEADYSEVIRLREEVKRLKSEIRATTEETEIERLNKDLQVAEENFVKVATEAANSGSAIEKGYKDSIEKASANLGRLNETLAEQKKKLDDVKTSIVEMKHAYNLNARNGMDMHSPEQSALLDKIKSAQNEQADIEVEVLRTTKAIQEQQGALQEVSDEYERFAKKTDDAKGVMSRVKDTLSSGLGLIGIGTSIVGLGSQMIQTRKQFQMIDSSIQTLLGSKEKADALLSQVKQYAAISPLELSSIASATQMMLGFNLEAEEVPKFISAIGDVSMGEAGKFNSLTLAFSQMSATGKLMGQDLNQMINAGFNPLSEISRTTGRSVAELKEEMSKGAISAKMVQDAFISATSAGGKFHNMSQESAKTIGGQMSMLQDSIDAMFNEWGEKSEGVIVNSIKGITSLIENYKKVGAVIGGLIAVYGTYRGVMATTVALENMRGKSLMGNIRALRSYIATTKVATAATKMWNTALKANPLVLLASVIVGATTALIGYSKAQYNVAEAEAEVAEKMDKVAEKENERINKTKELISIIRDKNKLTAEQVEAYQELLSIAPSITDAYTMEQLAVMDLTKVHKQLNEEKNKTIKSNVSEELATVEQAIQFYNNVMNNSLPTLSQKQARGKVEETYDLGGLLTSNDKKLELLRGIQNELLEQEAKIEKAEDEVRLSEMSPEARVKELKERKAGYEQREKEAGKSGLFAEEIGELDKRIEKEETAIKEQRSAVEKLKEARAELKKAQAEHDKMLKDGKATDTALKASSANIESKEERVEELEKLLGIDKKAREAKKKEAEEARKAQEKRDEEALTMKKQAESEMYNLQEDTHEKRVALIEAQYKEEIEQLAKQEAEWRKEQKNNLTRGQREALDLQRQMSLEKRSKSLSDELSEWLGDYTPAIEKYEALLDEMKEKKEQLQAMFESGEISEEQRNVGFQNAEDTFSTETEDIEEQIATKEGEFVEFTDTLERLSYEALERMLLEAQKQLIAFEYGAKPAEDIAILRQKIKKLRVELENKQGEEPSKRSFKQWAKLEEVIREVSGSFGTLGEQIGGTEGEVLKCAGNVMGSTMTMINSIQSFTEINKAGIETTAQAGQKAIKAVEKASVILMIISAAIQLMDQLTSFIKSDDEKWQERNTKTQEINRMKQAVNEYEMAVLRAKQAEKGWFAQSGVTSLRDDYEVGKKAMENYYSKANEMQEKYQNEAGGGWLVQMGRKVTGFVAEASKKMINVATFGLGDKVSKYIDPMQHTAMAYNAVNDTQTETGQVRAIDNLRIETRGKKKGFLGIGAKSQKTESVQEWMDKNMDGMKLFDEKNMIDIEAATLLLEKQGDKLVGNTKETIETLMKYREEYDAYIESLNEHVSEMYSPLVGSMTDAIMTWLETGEDALQTFKASAGDVFRDIVSDMIQTIVISNVVGTFQDDIKKLYEDYMGSNGDASATERLMQDVNKETQKLMERYEQQIPALQAMTENMEKTLAESGISLTGEESTEQGEATFGGYETMSEETGTELSGRFSAMYIVQSELLSVDKQGWEMEKAKLENLYAQGEVANDIMSSALLVLHDIRANTAQQPKAMKILLEKLEQWDEPIKNLL